MPQFNERIKQLLLLFLIILLIYLSIKELFIFMPGLLGAVTLYILSRAKYFQMVFNRKWKKGRAALMFMLYYLVLLGLPIFFSYILISPKIDAFLNDPSGMMNAAQESVMQVQTKLGLHVVTVESLNKSLSQLTDYIPKILNSMGTIITNLAVMLFILYYMLYHGSEMERYLNKIIPLKQENINILASETKIMVRANALGIPLISLIQGVTATIGYFFFGVKEWALWGFLTGIFAFFPVIGTMIVWVPLVIYTYASDHYFMATGLLIYSVIVTGNVDYLTRITLLKRMGNVHPVITILGVIIGLGLFGFIGLIFGPLLFNYIIVLFRIYMNEFVENKEKEAELAAAKAATDAPEEKKQA
jgi:predicted PurR-regulated permease PerM